MRFHRIKSDLNQKPVPDFISIDQYFNHPSRKRRFKRRRKKPGGIIWPMPMLRTKIKSC